MVMTKNTSKTYTGFRNILMKFLEMRAHIRLKEKQVDHLELPQQLAWPLSGTQDDVTEFYQKHSRLKFNSTPIKEVTNIFKTFL